MQKLNMYIALTLFADNFAVVNPFFCKWVGNSSAIVHRGVIIYNTGKTAINAKYITTPSMPSKSDYVHPPYLK